MKKLVFKDGYVVIVKSIRQKASEYSVEVYSYSVEVVFESKEGIKNFAKKIGSCGFTKQTEEKLLKQMEKTVIVRHMMSLPCSVVPVLLWYEHSKFETIIPTTQKSLEERLENDDEFEKYYKKYEVGSCAGGERFKEMVDEIIETGNVISCR